MNWRQIVLLFLFFLTSIEVKAQCSMCNATAESSLESGSTAAAGLNSGVLYLFFMPFIFAFIFFIIYKKRQQVINKESKSLQVNP